MSAPSNSAKGAARLTLAVNPPPDMKYTHTNVYRTYMCRITIIMLTLYLEIRFIILFTHHIIYYLYYFFNKYLERK